MLSLLAHIIFNLFGSLLLTSRYPFLVNSLATNISGSSPPQVLSTAPQRTIPVHIHLTTRNPKINPNTNDFKIIDKPPPSQAPAPKVPLTPLELPPEAKILPTSKDSKILVPSVQNNNLKPGVELALSHDTTTPPPGAYVVRHGGKSGEYSSIQAALLALKKIEPQGHNVTRTIFIYPGDYVETLIVDYQGPLRMIGYTTKSQDYGSNQVNITGKKDAATAGSDELSATVRIIKDDFSMYNINVYNTYGHQGHLSQAIALSGTGSKQAYYACSFIGYQDTLLTLNGYQYFSKCYIEGAVDFVFTQKAIVWFESVTTASTATGAITANGRDSDVNPSCYVFNKANVISKGAPEKSVFLGRPWGNYSRVVFQYSYLSDLINPLGWKSWGKTDTRTNHATYLEYKNTGPGSVLLTSQGDRHTVGNSNATEVKNGNASGVPPGSRANFSRQSTRPYLVTETLGKDYKLWVDPAFDVASSPDSMEIGDQHASKKGVLKA